MNPDRVRLRVNGLQLGAMINLVTHETVDSEVYTKWQRTEDTVGYLHQDNYFDTEIRWSRVVGTVSGKPPTDPVFLLIDFPYGSQFNWAHIPRTSPTSDEDAVAEAAARTNPSRAVTSMPSFLGELKDLPFKIFTKGMQIKADHKQGSNRSPNSVVGFNFAFAPLIRDLFNMFQFQERVNERVVELTALHSKGGLKRRWDIDGETLRERFDNVTVWSVEGADVVVSILKTTRWRSWATIGWLPDVPDLLLSQADLREQAKFTVHGWNLSLVDVWELLPWSWFADYFGNVGNYLAANRNAVNAHVASACVMTSAASWTQHVVTTQTPWLSTTAAQEFYETKHRTPNVPVELNLATSPFLGQRQLLTLASIASHYR